MLTTPYVATISPNSNSLETTKHIFPVFYTSKYNNGKECMPCNRDT